MARTFRSRRAAHAIAEVNVTNLIDLAFILLVVFMIVTPLIQQEQTLPIDLPKVAKMPQQKADKDDRFVAVGVDARGFYVENNTEPLTLDELGVRLKTYAQEPNPPVIRIRGDSRVVYQRVAELFAEVQKAGLTRFTIDSQTEN